MMRRGHSRRSVPASNPRRSTAPGPRLWMKMSLRARSVFRTCRASGCFRSRVNDSFDRFSQTKWLHIPFTVVSYPRAKSPVPGRSILITRAPRSASWRVANGAATACSSARTVQPLRGSIAIKYQSVRDLDVKILTETTARLLVEANYQIPPDILAGLRRAAAEEESELGRQTLEHLVHNYEVAAAERLPVCQDSGITVVLLEVGQDVHWTGGNLREAIFEGITQGTKQGYLRWSLVGDPLAR